MGRETGEILLIVTDDPGPLVDGLREKYADEQVAVLDLASGGGESLPLPASWRRLRPAEYLDTDLLRRDFLAFLDAWPRQPLWGGRTFDEMFRRPEGYSVWWTGPGAERHPDQGVFPTLKALWICDRAIRAVVPERVLIYCRQAHLATCLASRCRQDRCPYEFLPGSVGAMLDPWRGRLRWLGESLLRLVGWPAYVAVRAIIARWLSRVGRERCAQCQEPAIVFSSEFSRYYRTSAGRVVLDHWKEISQALGAKAPRVRLRYRVRMERGFSGYREVLRLYHTGWRLLRRFPGAIPLHEQYVVLFAQLRFFPGHLSSILRYARLESRRAFRTSFTFAGADVASLYVPELRRTLARQGVWAQTVAAIAESLRAVGNVKAVVVCEEMYPVGMLEIAAARRLGIPSLGVQHGTIFPMHLIYTIPSGQVHGAPVPDYFAVYSPFAGETVSVHGAYPADRVWIGAGTRFDRLINHAQAVAEARAQVGLPIDDRVIVLATQKYDWFPSAARAVMSAVGVRPDCVVCVKIHPNDPSMETYRQIAREVGAINVRFFDRHFEELLVGCDVLISGSSTSVLEAILLGRRAICLNFSDEPDRYPYVSDGGSLGARSVAEVRVALERVFAERSEPDLDRRRREFLQRHAGPSAEGRAAATLAQHICDTFLADPLPCRGQDLACKRLGPPA